MTTILRASPTACLAPATLPPVPSRRSVARQAIYAKRGAGRASVQFPDIRRVTLRSHFARDEKVALVAYRN
ncbi:hypothetical protein GCM10019016_051570 [Streptomyces prasinosporus]|uniref:Uncharacterized protein n=1 Tax=Streptomyces prasinosporus TaxID=68256 RepID=A0ABP6TTI1_9ACTN